MLIKSGPMIKHVHGEAQSQAAVTTLVNLGETGDGKLRHLGFGVCAPASCLWYFIRWIEDSCRVAWEDVFSH